MAQLPSSPAVAILDQTNTLNLSWQPPVGPDGLYDQYSGWQITLSGPANVSVGVPAPVGYLGTAMSYSQLLVSSPTPFSLTMYAIANGIGGSTNSNPWQTSGTSVVRAFPTPLASSYYTFSATSLLLDQALTVTLSSGYTGADQWQVIWPDGTSTGWLPLASNVVVKSFSSPGTDNVVIQTRRNYSASQYNPPATLISQNVQQIFVINQQAPSTTAGQSGISGSLGIGGQQGFEITNNTSGTVTPEPWEMIARALVRDTVTSELKLLVATSRFSNASSLLGTMAVDVFPIEGRPRSKELIVPPYELTATSTTESTVCSIATSVLPTLYVGKSVVQALGGTFQMQANGTAPFIWNVDPLPEGVTMNTSGIINGTPLVLGTFEVAFSAQDSSTPASVAHTTLTMTVETDLKVQIAANQYDGSVPTPQPLAQNGSTLGVSQVGTPYSVQMQVGNINPNSSLPGGLPPYTWSTPAGAFPPGLSISPVTGLISGTPSTYNSTTDFTTPYTVTIQVTDSIGAKATNTYSMTLIPMALTLGKVNQPTIYAFQEFKLDVPVFGGVSPYTLTGFSPLTPGDNNYFNLSPQIVDGRIEINIGAGASTRGGIPNSGIHAFSVSVQDSATPTPNSATKQFSLNVETENSDIRLVSGYLTNEAHPTDGSWGLYDTSQAYDGYAGHTGLEISGNLSGYSLGGTRVNLTAVAAAVLGSTVYTGYVPSSATSGVNFAVSGFANPLNNGTFACTATTPGNPGTITLSNPNGVVQTASTFVLNGETAPIGTVNILSGVLTIGAPMSPPTTYAFVPGQNVTFSSVGTATFLNGQTVTVLPTGLSSTQFTANFTHTDYPGGSDTGYATAPSASLASSGSTVYTGTITGGGSNAFAGNLFVISGYTKNPQNNGIFPCTVSTATTLTLGNAAGLLETTTASAVRVLGKALEAAPLSNGISVAVDPTILSAAFLPDVEFYGPPGPSALVPSAYFGNDQWEGQIGVNQTFALTTSGNASGGNTSYTWSPAVGTGASYIGRQFTVTGFLTTLSGDYSTNDNGTYIAQAGTNDTTLVLNNPSGLANYTSITSSSATSNVLSLGFASIPIAYAAGQWLLLGGMAEATLNGKYVQVLTSTTTSLTANLPPNFTIGNYSNPSDTGTITVPQPSATATVNNVFAVSRLYETLSHNDPATYVLTSVATSVGGTAVYTGTITGGGSNAFAGYYFTVTGFGTNPTLNNGYFLCSASTAATLTLVNPNAVAESNTASATGDIGAITTYTRPYLVGDVIGFNPRKPIYNSPNIPSFSAVNAWTAGVAPEFALPLGLSLDANTGLVYGTLTGTYATPSLIQYIDAAGVVHGAVTVNWFTYQSAFQLTDNVIDSQVVGTAWVSPIGGDFSAPVGVTLQSVSVLYGRLPSGLSVSASGSGIVISGTPTEAGYFDVWFQAQSTNSQNAYVYHRISTTIPVATLVIKGWSDPSFPTVVNDFPLPNAVIGVAYGPSGSGVQLVAANGIPAYIWSSSPTMTPFNGLTLDATGATPGKIHGIATPLFATTLFSFTVTDTAFNTYTVNNVSLSSQVSGLAITTASIPTITSGKAYSPLVTLAASLGTPPYSFSISPVSPNPSLPTGMTMSGGGAISGTSIESGFSKPITFRVTDSVGSYADKQFTVSVVSGLTLTAGPDYEDAISTGYLGYVDAGNVSTILPRPNDSFYVVATGVVSTTVSQMSVSVSNSNITATITSLDTVHGVALIQLAGSFAAGSSGDNSLVVSVTDSGVSASATFKWKVFTDGTMILTPSSGTFPTKLISGQ
jgi:hypothetical protein